MKVVGCEYTRATTVSLGMSWAGLDTMSRDRAMGTGHMTDTEEITLIINGKPQTWIRRKQAGKTPTTRQVRTRKC